MTNKQFKPINSNVRLKYSYIKIVFFMCLQTEFNVYKRQAFDFVHF